MSGVCSTLHHARALEEIFKRQLPLRPLGVDFCAPLPRAVPKRATPSISLAWQCYRATSLIRNRLPLGPYCRIMHGAPRWFLGAGQFLLSEVALYPLLQSGETDTPRPRYQTPPVKMFASVQGVVGHYKHIKCLHVAKLLPTSQCGAYT